MKTIFLFTLILVTLSVANGQQLNNKSTDLLLVSPTKFKLQAANVSYQGENCSPSDKTDKVFTDTSKVIKIKDEVYYQGNWFYRISVGDGLVVENLTAKTCRVYPMFGLAESAGWFKRSKDDGGLPNATRGLFRVGNTLWMGSNGIGVAVFDLERKTWSRFDLKSSVIAGDHLSVEYADDNYAFVIRGEFPNASLHIYSVKQNKWLGLKSVSTSLVSEYGYNWDGSGLPTAQVTVDHRGFAKQKYLPIDWTFMGLHVTLIDNGKSYLFENKFSKTKTVFVISKSEFKQVFEKSF